MFGSNLQCYGCADVDALIWIWEKLPGMMKERGVWNGYQEIFRNHIILESARLRGVPVNIEKHGKLKGELLVRRSRLNKELQKDIPDEIKNISPKTKGQTTGVVDYGYIRTPKEIKLAKGMYDSYVGLCKGRDKKPVGIRRYIRIRFSLIQNKFTIINKQSGEFEEVTRWCKVIPFKASKDQLVRYLVGSKLSC